MANGSEKTLLVRNVVCDPTKASIFLSTVVDTEEMSTTVTLLPGAEAEIPIPTGLVAAEVAGEVVESLDEGESLEAIKQERDELAEKLDQADAQLTAVPGQEEPTRELRELREQNAEYQEAATQNEHLIGAVRQSLESSLRQLRIADLEKLQKSANVQVEGNKDNRVNGLLEAFDNGDTNEKIHVFGEVQKLEKDLAAKKASR
jgi:hypothetical protein